MEPPQAPTGRRWESTTSHKSSCGFATTPDRSHVWLFDKKTCRWSHAAIAKVAQEPDYYAPDVERRLAIEVEAPGHRALDRLRRGETLDSSGRDAFAYYLAAMIMRVPRRRRKGEELFPKVLQSSLADTRRELAELTTEDNSERVGAMLDVLERIERDYQRQTPAFIRRELAEPWPSARTVDAIRRMTWRLVDVPRSLFLFTTDNPSFFFDSVGVGTDQSELTVPLGSNLGLLGSYQGEPGAVYRATAKAALVKEINRRIASGAERFVFSPKKASWIETLALRLNPYLSRVQW